MRVIAGRFKAQPISKALSCTRPTTDRTKEAIFSRLDTWGVLQPQARVLDLFAGTGALGIEALSRGANTLTSVEANSSAANLISATLKQLMQSPEWKPTLHTQVVRKNAESFAENYAGPAYELIFIDPPYAYTNEECAQLLQNLVDREIAACEVDTLIVLERSVRTDTVQVPDGWEIFDTRNYGETAVHYIQAISVADTLSVSN